jgi:hypothetical protein
MGDDERDNMYRGDSDDGGEETVCRGDGGGESGVTEVQNGSDAAAGKAQRRRDLSDGGWALTEETTAAYEAEPCSPIRLVAAGCGCLLLGFFAGAIAAAAWLFLKTPGRPEQWIVPT